jgi:predicted HD superfamily hydrolase involved in NAD metabolism
MASLTHDQLVAVLKRKLPRTLFSHALAVSRLAERLARRHGWNPALAARTGLLHDYARAWPRQKLVRYIRTHRLKIPDASFSVHHSPGVLHAYVAARAVAEEGWLRNRAARQAIAAHTLGPERGLLPEKIIFMADLCAADRRYSFVPNLRKLAFADLDRAVLKGRELKLRRLIEKGRPVHPHALRCWNRILSK